ncbi:MAG: zinc ribbon domain-containing protein [Clostridia bacterium]|nr:zinc ribbon domain-containing protein [Clostridia bacterium]
MKECVNCGSKQDNNAVFCRQCGGELIKIEESRCKVCGISIDSGLKICENCSEEMNSAADVYDAYPRDLIPVKERNDKSLLIILTTAVVVCALAIFSVCALLFSEKNELFPGKENSSVSVDSETDTENEISNQAPDEAANQAEEPKQSQPIIEYREAPATTTRVLYDYDYDSKDWYRLRKSENGVITQVGAYKTVEQALYYADIYCPQGYTLYDKDFNVIR